MHHTLFLSLLLSFGLPLTASPLPQTQTPSPTPQPPLDDPTRDPCGPTIQPPGSPNNTCTEPPTTVLRAGQNATTYGISLLRATEQLDLLLDWDRCRDPIEELCSNIETATLDRWHWTHTPLSAPSTVEKCQLGAWLPGTPGSAPPPSPAQCKRIFNAMLSARDADHASESGIVGATVNLDVLPVVQPGMLSGLPGLSVSRLMRGTGSAVDAGYPSYAVQYRNVGGRMEPVDTDAFAISIDGARVRAKDRL